MLALGLVPLSPIAVAATTEAATATELPFEFQLIPLSTQMQLLYVAFPPILSLPLLPAPQASSPSLPKRRRRRPRGWRLAAGERRRPPPRRIAASLRLRRATSGPGAFPKMGEEGGGEKKRTWISFLLSLSVRREKREALHSSRCCRSFSLSDSQHRKWYQTVKAFPRIGNEQPVEFIASSRPEVSPFLW